MKSIFFDAGPIISLSTNNLLWILEDLKNIYKGKFYFSGSVKNELIDVPYKIKKFKFEAIQIMKAVERGIFEVIPQEKTSQLAEQLLEIANGVYSVQGTKIKIVHKGEIDTIAGAKLMGSEAVVIDERTTRMLIENPYELKNLLGSKLHKKIRVDEENLKKLRDAVEGIKIIRSAELVVVAYEKGLIEQYLPRVPEAKKELLDGILWGVKLNGCALSREEIDKIIEIELRKR
ncbi:MAG: hypothetical protein QXG86_00125 [Candidatus Woesearchaeota archaeon]